MSPEPPSEGQPLSPGPQGTGQTIGQPKPPEISAAQAPPAGGRRAFRDIRRELTDDELRSPGVQKILYDDLEQCELEREELRGYVKLYYEADKRAAICEERQRSVNAIEVFFGVGLGLGGALLGLVPQFLTETSKLPGICLGVVGAALMLGSCAGRFIKK